MKVFKKNESGVCILQFQGRIDALALQEVSAELNRALGDGSGKVLVDLSKTEYMSSAGLHALTDAQKLSYEGGGKMALCSASEDLMELFRVVHLERCFEIYPNDFEALDKLID
ncbi:MAG: STAS domain-containing protein [Candidatus Omnitrophica bacterium]|nr:STAS domain-containing protein [Candidatus Omnitrophota bacterium]